VPAAAAWALVIISFAIPPLWRRRRAMEAPPDNEG